MKLRRACPHGGMVGKVLSICKSHSVRLHPVSSTCVGTGVTQLIRHSTVFALTLCVAVLLPTADAASDLTPTEVFEKRIVPIFKSPNPSSCVQCHLAGVDLKDYILPDAEKTFRSLRDQGLIDLGAPEKSKIVKLIDMGGDKGPATIHAKARKAEREAFVAWITACAADPKLRAAPSWTRRIGRSQVFQLM